MNEGDLNTATTVKADTDDLTYYDIPNLQSDYYNNKTIIFTSGTSKDISTTITDFEKE